MLKIQYFFKLITEILCYNIVSESDITEKVIYKATALKGALFMKNFLSIIGAVAAAVAVFAAVAIIVKKVKFKFVISSADAEPCDYDCDNCDDGSCDYDDDDFLGDWDDIEVEEPEVEVEICEIEEDDSITSEEIDNVIKATEASIEEEVENELGNN